MRAIAEVMIGSTMVLLGVLLVPPQVPLSVGTNETSMSLIKEEPRGKLMNILGSTAWPSILSGKNSIFLFFAIKGCFFT